MAGKPKSATNGCSTTTAVLAVSATACNNFNGGSNDGFGFAAFCGNNLNGASTPAIALNPITGTASFCVNASQIYAVSLSSGTADSFVWTTPPGTTLTTMLSTPASSTNNFLLGATSGTISVSVINSCGTATGSLALTAVNCNDFFGGNNDGFSTAFFCGNDLNGATLGIIALTPISGNAAFCNNLGQNYSVSLTSGTASLFVWTIPAGSALE